MSGSNSNGFVAIRRGILDHGNDGGLPPLQFAAYVYLILEANCETGAVRSCAKSLSSRYGFNDRYARQILEDLEEKGYIRRFATPGRHGEYPILVNKYMVSRGARSGLMLNPAKSDDWRNPVFEKREENREGNREVNSSYQEREGERERNTSCEPKDRSHGSGSLFEPPDLMGVVKQVWDYYLERLGKNPKILTLSTKRKQKGLARLKEALKKTNGDLEKAEKLMKLAVDAMAASEWHAGASDHSKRYDSWENNLFPNQEKFEWWLEKAQSL